MPHKTQRYMKKKETTKRERVRGAAADAPYCAFTRLHFALTGLAVVLIVAGCLLMLPEADVRNRPGGRYAAAPGPGAFDARRIRLAPIPLFIGYAMMVPVIMMKVKSERVKSEKWKVKNEK